MFRTFRSQTLLNAPQDTIGLLGNQGTLLMYGTSILLTWFPGGIDTSSVGPEGLLGISGALQPVAEVTLTSVLGLDPWVWG